MSGTMSLDDLAADLEISLRDVAELFDGPAGDFARLVRIASGDFNRVRPRTLVGSITVQSDRQDYPAPADFFKFKSSLWGIAPKPRSKPWEKSWPGRLPAVEALAVTGGSYLLNLSPAPTAQQIASLGAEFRFYYFAAHVIGADSETTITLADRGLLLLRAQAEAMREVSMRNSAKPVSMRDGFSGTPRNSTPAAMYKSLLEEFEQVAAA